MLPSFASQYWENAHVKGDMAKLSDHSLALHAKDLGVEKLLQEVVSVLCVGVGTGGWIRELLALETHDVSVLDVSRTAVLKVPSVPGYLDPKLLPSDRFDLALSLWVTPHISDVALVDQLSEVVRALRKGGRYAMMYASPFFKDHVEVVPSGGLVKRTDGAIREMVESVGGRVEKDWVFSEVPERFLCLRTVHVGVVGC